MKVPIIEKGNNKFFARFRVLWTRVLWIFSLFLVAFSFSQLAFSESIPSWVAHVPPSLDSYYVVGVGTAETRAEASSKARQDALSQIVLGINASISTQSSFTTAHEESLTTGQVSDFQEAYRKIQVRGNSAVQGFRVQRTHFESASKGGVNCYVLGKIDKEELEKSIQKMEELREELSQTHTLVLALNINPFENEIAVQESLNSFLEEFYQSQGYSVFVTSLDLELLSKDSAYKNISELSRIIQDEVDSPIQKLVYATVIIEKQYMDKERSFSFYIQEGSLILREISIESKKILFTKRFRDKGVSSRNFESAHTKLEEKLLTQFLGNTKSSASSEDYYY